MSTLIKINENCHCDGVFEIDDAVHTGKDGGLQFLRGIMYDFFDEEKKPNLCLGGIKNNTEKAEIFYYKLVNDKNAVPEFYSFDVDPTKPFQVQELSGHKELVIRTKLGVAHWKRFDAAAKLSRFTNKEDVQSAKEKLAAGIEETHHLPHLMDDVRRIFNEHMNKTICPDDITK